MRREADVAIPILTLLVLWASPWGLFAQAPKPPSLQEQLEAQYPPGTVLAIQKEGILGVASTSSKTCAAKYQNGSLKPPEVSCAAPLKNSSRLLTVGEKVYPSKIQVNLAQEKISFAIVECDSCNKGTLSSSYKAQIDFQFAKGYLETASVSKVEDTISQVLSFGESTDQQPQPAQNSSEVLTNNDVVKMVTAKLGDGIIIDTIKTSACNFDTSVNGMVKLKTAGVSDPVIQAMREAQAAPKASDEPAPAGDSVAGHYVNDKNVAEYLDLGSDSKFFLRERGRNFAGSYEISGDTLMLRVPGGQTPRAKVVGERLIDDEGKNWVRQGGPPSAPAPSPVPGQMTFSVRHRHSVFWNFQTSAAEYYCSGTLSVSPDGTVAYDCAQTEDPSGRCEHVSLAPGSLKQAKIGLGGSLHLASKTQGNFDFYGNRDDIKQAQAAIAPLIPK